MLAVAEEVTASTLDAEEPCHYICPLLPDLAYCGKNVSDSTWLPPLSDGEPTAEDCALCILAWEMSEDQCPTCKTPWEQHEALP
jgi:hypothetical protein